jgi:hypothetical protein
LEICSLKKRNDTFWRCFLSNFIQHAELCPAKLCQDPTREIRIYFTENFLDIFIKKEGGKLANLQLPALSELYGAFVEQY